VALAASVAKLAGLVLVHALQQVVSSEVAIDEAGASAPAVQHSSQHSAHGEAQAEQGSVQPLGCE
jgi:hypothetical protein